MLGMIEEAAGTRMYENKKLAGANKAPAQVVVFPKDTDAFQALRVGQVDAYGTTVKTAGYYFTQAPDLFEIAGSRRDSAFASVAVQPGAIAFTVMPRGPSSAAAIVVSAFSAALAIE